ncbi:MAG TPA: diguanylate cyclase [Abditibacteriaceae bacterium]
MKSPASMLSSGSVTSSGILVLCDRQGVIVKVAYDGLGLTSHLRVGQPFARAIGACGAANDAAANDAAANDAASGDAGVERQYELARLFMETLMVSGVAFGWEIPVLLEGQMTTLRLTGGSTNDGLLIVGDATGSDARQIVEELVRINNETVNALRVAAKTAAKMAAQKEVPSQGPQERADQSADELLVQLSRANNEVITAQRELARKNAVLSHTNAALEEARATLEAKQAALEEANLRLDALATTDGLTGVKNRRAFEEKLAEEITRSTRYGPPLSLLLLDVDKFKQYNDSFGHIAGDQILKTVAHLLREHARSTDFVARYGGEEFVLVLPNTGAEGAIILAERLRTIIEAAPWPQRAVTASFGAATFGAATFGAASLSGDSTPTALIEAADRALYASKEGGRNRVTHVGNIMSHAE